MIKAVIFDCFGVLVTEGWLSFKNKYFGQDKQLYTKAAELMDRADAGLVSHEEFVEQVAKMSGLSTSEVNKRLDVNHPNEELFEYIAKNLNPQYKIGMLSNAAADWLNELFSREQLELFDAMALSYKTGFIKPNSRAYQSIAGQLGVEPEECVFIDDQQRHINAAREVGMQAILYKNFAQMKHELEEILK